MSLHSHLREQRYLYLVELLSRHRGDRAAVCREARISQATLYRVLRRLVSTHHPVRSYSSPRDARVRELLVYFGVRDCEQRRGDWACVYNTARANYLTMVKALHPDSGGATSARTERFLAVNAAWRKVEAYLARKAA